MVRRLIANVLLAGLSLVLLWIAAEAAFRAFPVLLPTGVYGAGRFDPELGMNVHAATVYYNKARRTARGPNAAGMLDAEHEETKPQGVARVGIFGDSYVESAQVDLEDAFFRRIASRDLEPLAFGMSGWGTLHAMRAADHFGPRYDLDLELYVFVENDPGDNSLLISGGKRVSPIPYARMRDDGSDYELAWARRPGERPLWLRAIKAVQSRSLVFQLVINRMRLFQLEGVRVRRMQGADDMIERARGAPDPNDLPPSWPDVYRVEATGLAERILRDWKQSARARGHDLWVLYVPRGESQLHGELDTAETWRPWLGRTCDALGLPLLDPTPALRSASRAGAPMYADHWTPEGHAVIARVLREALETRLGYAP